MNKPRSIIVAVLIAIFIWVAFDPPGKLENFKMSLISMSRGPLRIISSIMKYVNELSTIHYVDREKRELRRRIGELENELTTQEEVKLENMRLRQLLNFKENLKRTSVPALVIGRDPNNWSSVVYIDKGKNDGLKNDIVVISSEGLVGRIRETSDAMSKVMLINDIDSKVGAIVQRNREEGLLIGTQEGSCKMIYLSLDSDVSIGDRIMTSGMGGIYPKGIPIGKVVGIAIERGNLYKYAIAEPSSELSKLEEVLCIK